MNSASYSVPACPGSGPRPRRSGENGGASTRGTPRVVRRLERPRWDGRSGRASSADPALYELGRELTESRRSAYDAQLRRVGTREWGRSPPGEACARRRRSARLTGPACARGFPRPAWTVGRDPCGPRSARGRKARRPASSRPSSLLLSVSHHPLDDLAEPAACGARMTLGAALAAPRSSGSRRRPH